MRALSLSRTAAVLALAAAGLSACSLGPGVRCRTDEDCGGWGSCTAVSGGSYCVLRPPRAELATEGLRFESCGGAPVHQRLILTNTGGANLTFAAAVDLPGTFAVSPAEGTLRSREAVQLEIAANGATEVDGQLTLTTNDADRPRLAVPLLVRVIESACSPGPTPTPTPTPQPNPDHPLALSTVELFFGTGGRVSCGTRSAARTLTLTNLGAEPVTWSAALGKGAASPFTVSPASGTIEAGSAPVTLTVAAAEVPAQAPTAEDALGDTLIVSSSVDQGPAQLVVLRQTASGARLALSPAALDLGATRVGSTSSAQFSVVNEGNAAAQVRLASSSAAFTAGPASPARVEAGAAAALTASFTPTTLGPQAATAALSVDPGDVLCAPLPPALALRGTGTDGRLGTLSAASLTFGAGGLVPCGSTAAPQSVTLTNTSGGALALTVAFDAASASRFSATAPSTLAAGAAATITVAPSAIPATASTAPDGFGGALSITAAGGGLTQTWPVRLHQTAQGAVLSFAPTSLSFSAERGKKQSRAFTLANSGNLAAPYVLTVGGADALSFSVTPLAGQAQVGATVSGQATFTAPQVGTGQRVGAVNVATTAARCAPLPSIALSGTIKK